MHLTSLELRNFRGFPSLNLELHPRMTVLIGDNAAGKSSVLDALSVSIGSWFLGFPDVATRPIHDDEIRRARHERPEGPQSVEPTYPVQISTSGCVGHKRISWLRELRKSGGKTTYGDAKDIRSLAESAAAAVQEGKPSDLPVVAYYGAGRLWKQKRDSTIKQAGFGSRLGGYADSLDPASNHKLFEAWMKWREEERLQKVAEAVETNELSEDSIRMPGVEAVRGPVTQCIPNATRLFYSVKYQELRVELAGAQLPFALLSDGYRNFLGMVADLAWRAYQLNPQHGDNASAEARGVVLIDEVDLHLHPSWQRSVLSGLVEAFPNLQFVVTTHSPQVVASARPEWIRALHEGAVSQVDRAFGRDSNVVLRDIMGVEERPSWMIAKLEKLADYIEVGDKSKAQGLLDEISADLGEQDDTVVGLRWEIHMLAANASQ